MKNKACYLLFTFIIFGAALAQAEDVPEVIKRGFKVYNAAGPKAAIEYWLKGSSLDGLSQANILSQGEDYFGSYQGYDLFKSIALGPKSRLYLITINFQKGALFAKFLTYEPEGRAVIVQMFHFNAEVDQVWPPNMVYVE